MCSRMENPTPDTHRFAVTRTSQTLWQTYVFWHGEPPLLTPVVLLLHEPHKT